jgi:predicted esterase
MIIDTRTIGVTTHGRYLVVEPRLAASEPAPLLIGFHGYGEDAAVHLERLTGIPGQDRWRVVSIQALHRFYRRLSEAVVASWMTREDREWMIRDNVAYVGAVVDAVKRERPSLETLVLAGFSQGAAMAFRAAVLGTLRPRGVISLGGDIPPEFDQRALASIPSALVGRGERDEWYTAEKHDRDRDRLAAAGVAVEAVTLPAGHEWTAEFSAAAASFLSRCE